jgi:hypothetical protein
MKVFLVVLAFLAVAYGGYYYLQNRPSAPANPILLQQVQNAAANDTASSTSATATSTALQQDSVSLVAGMTQYIDPDLGFSFWYPSSWNITHFGGLDGDPHSYVQLNNDKNIEVFEITKNTTDQHVIGALATTTMGGLLVFQTTVQISNEWGANLGTTSLYLLPLTSDVAAPPSLLVSTDSNLNSLPLIQTITATSSAVAAPLDVAGQATIIQAEKRSYVGGQ